MTTALGAAERSSVPRWASVRWSAHAQEALVLGRRLRYLDYGAGPPLVLIHGLGGSWHTWLENLPALGREHRVIAVDLPGFGGSEPLPPPADMATHVDALAALLAQLGAERAVVVGHSMGGLIALLLAAAHPDRVDRLVLVNAGGVPISPARLAAIVRVFRVFYALGTRPGVMRAVARRGRLRRAMLSGFLADPASLSPQLAAEVIPLMAAPGFVGALAAASRVVGDIRPEDIACPVLLIWGDKDRILPLAQAERLALALPDARLEVLRGVGHCPMFERPAEFDRALLEFTRLPR